MYGMGIQTMSIATDGSITAGFDIRGAAKVAFEIPTFAVGLITATANVKFQVARVDPAGTVGTYRPFFADGVYSANSGVREFEIPSTSGHMMVDMPQLAGYDYVKLQVSNTATATYNPILYTIQKPPM